MIKLKYDRDELETLFKKYLNQRKKFIEKVLDRKDKRGDIKKMKEAIQILNELKALVEKNDGRESGRAIDELSVIEEIALANRVKMEYYIKAWESDDFKKNRNVESMKTSLKSLFSYSSFRKNKIAFDLAKKLEMRVCPYCNRQYTLTIKTDNRDKKVFPAFDHYYPKDKYPFLAISLYNLIPCCNDCNGKKGNHDTFNEPICYPYEDGQGEDIRFGLQLKDDIDLFEFIYGKSDKFDIKLEAVRAETKEVAERQIDKLKLNLYYSGHKPEVQDIILKNTIYSEEYIDKIMNNFKGLFTSREELLSLIYGSDMQKKDFGKQPLSKMTYDIYHELEDKRMEYEIYREM